MPSIRRSAAIVAGPVLALLLATTVVARPESPGDAEDTGAAGTDSPRHAHGTFVDATGATIGSVRLTEDRDGVVRVRVKVKGLTPGLHGIHIHAVGSCDPVIPPAVGAPFFLAAGGHYNPDGHQHGLDNPAGPHAGDLPNLVVDEHGIGRLRAETDRVTLTDGPTTLFDSGVGSEGSAFIIHANPDNQTTDVANGGPANGNSGARIACAVILPGR